MERLQFSVQIQAPPERVWNTMLDDAPYRAWTEPFMPGSYYEGDWSEGSKMRFLGPGDDGKTGGMVARVKENRPHEYVSLEHYGVINENVEDTTSEEVKAWAGAQENYTFRPNNGGTEVRVEVDTADDYKQMFEDMWPRALQKLKQIAET
jgi:uncharacterized protein YndB with AHSA1/START domain